PPTSPLCPYTPLFRSAELVRGTVHADVVARTELLARDLFAHGGREGLGATAGHRVEAGLAQGDEHLFPRLLLDAGDVRDLDRRQDRKSTRLNSSHVKI